MENHAILELDHISKSYDGKSVLKDITLSFCAGERVALIGSSGAGKSTLLNLIIRDQQPDSGSICVDGNVVDRNMKTKEYAKKVGIIRQQFDLIPSLSVVHNVLVGQLHEWGFWKSMWSLIRPLDTNRVRDVLDRVGIENKIWERTGLLSGGEQQRVALARVMMQDPFIILADEPISSLDPTRSHAIMKHLVDMCRKDKKCLIASMHSVEHVLEYFTRAVGLKDGNILFDKPVHELERENLAYLYAIEESHGQ